MKGPRPARMPVCGAGKKCLSHAPQTPGNSHCAPTIPRLFFAHALLREELRVTGAVLGRSLSGLHDLVNRSLADARLTSGTQNLEPIVVGEFLEEVEVSAAMEARARGLSLTVVRVDGDVVVQADRQILTSVVGNLLQNAFKYSLPEGHVSLRSSADAGRVRIEVEDECGGLPPGDPRALFIPYEQRGDDRTGLGLGLAISRRGVEASGGALNVRNLPGKGCVFTVDLPRAAVSVKLHIVGARPAPR